MTGTDTSLEQLALTGVGFPPTLCGVVRVDAVDRAGRYRLVCTRPPHGDEVEHAFSWLTDLHPVVTVTPAEVL